MRAGAAPPPRPCIPRTLASLVRAPFVSRKGLYSEVVDNVEGVLHVISESLRGRA